MFSGFFFIWFQGARVELSAKNLKVMDQMPPSFPRYCVKHFHAPLLTPPARAMLLKPSRVLISAFSFTGSSNCVCHRQMEISKKTRHFRERVNVKKEDMMMDVNSTGLAAFFSKRRFPPHLPHNCPSYTGTIPPWTPQKSSVQHAV